MQTTAHRLRAACGTHRSEKQFYSTDDSALPYKLIVLLADSICLFSYLALQAFILQPSVLLRKKKFAVPCLKKFCFDKTKPIIRLSQLFS